MFPSLIRFLCVAVLIAGTIPGQSALQPLEFEVALIKPAVPGAQGYSLEAPPGGGLTVRNMTLRDLITFAYDIRGFQLTGGPDWINTEPYDISAKTARSEASSADPSQLPADQRELALVQSRERTRSLLADRFALTTHHELREQTVYLLTVGKNGTKLREVTNPGAETGTRGNGRGHRRGLAVPISVLTAELSNATGRLVLDKTGLTGRYDWALDWAADAGAGPDPDNRGAGPTLFTALQEQLGLRLESGKAPVDTLVIDRVDRPSAN